MANAVTRRWFEGLLVEIGALERDLSSLEEMAPDDRTTADGDALVARLIHRAHRIGDTVFAARRDLL